MSLDSQRFFSLGSFRLDIGRRLLLRGNEPMMLRPRVFDTLVLLVEKRGEVVTKEELIDAVWPDTVVEENNLNQNILALRRIFESAGNGDVRIETVPRRGYRLLAPPEEAAQTVAAAPAPEARITEPPMRRTRPALRRRRLAMAALAAGAIVVATGAIWRLRHATRPISGVRSIAVLPLKSLGLPAGGDYVGLGIADAVITRLGYARTLSVRPTASVQGLRESGADPVAAGRALHVDAVLDGQIQKSGDRIRVTVQLIGVREGSAIWSEKFDVKAADLFTLEDSISESVVRALASGLSAGEAQRVGRDRPTTPEAYRAYLEGRYFWNRRTEAGDRKARQLFERAIALDPNYGPAYAGLADTLNHLVADPRLKRQAAEKALALDDSLAEAYASLGNTSLFTDWNITEAEKDFHRALDLNPSYATAHQWYAYCFLVRGDLPGAQQEVRRAQLVDPLSPSIGVDVALMLYYGRHYDDAILELRRVLELQPGFGQATQLLPVVLLQKGELEAAKRECPPISSANPNLTNACLALVAAHTGDRSAAEQRLEGIAPSARWFFEALVAIALGDGDRAMTALEVGYRFRNPSLLVIGADPLFDDLHSDPRFLGLLERIGVTPLPAA